MADLPDPPPESGLTRDDVLRARETWKRFCPPAWRSLLNSPAVGKPSDREWPEVPPFL